MRIILFGLFMMSTMVSCLAPGIGRGARIGNEVTNSLNKKSNAQRASRSGGPQAGMPSKPGSCYAKCLMPDVYNNYQDEFYVFTGDPNNTDVEIYGVEYIVQAATSGWEKRKSDNCMSANPDDCLVWCKVDKPEIVENYIVVADTSQTDQYEIVMTESRELVSKGGNTEWLEVICEKDLTKKVVIEIQNFLFAQLYYMGPIDGKNDKEVRDALVKYQRASGLAVGQLTIETLQLMGIKY